MILFNGGMDIGWRRFRASAWPILSVGLLGTFATAGLVAVLAHYALGFDWTLAGLVGPRWRRPIRRSCSRCSAGARWPGARARFWRARRASTIPSGSRSCSA